jgi:alkyl hydroperoxide reductase subunit AhpC
MIELGQLDAAHEEFQKRNVRVIVASIEDEETARATKTDFPSLVVVADSNRGLTNAVAVIHPESAPDQSDTAAPTTLLVDGQGVVRWVFRSENVFRRLSPAEVLAKVDEMTR